VPAAGTARLLLLLLAMMPGLGQLWMWLAMRVPLPSVSSSSGSRPKFCQGLRMGQQVLAAARLQQPARLSSSRLCQTSARLLLFQALAVDRPRSSNCCCGSWCGGGSSSSGCCCCEPLQLLLPYWRRPLLWFQLAAALVSCQ